MQAPEHCLPDVMTLDADYWVRTMLKYARIRELTLIPPPAGSCMARKLRSKKGSKIYAQCKVTVEPVSGQIKECRGLRRFLLRGLDKVNGEWHLIATTHNLLKLFRHRRSQQQALVAATG